MEKTVRTSRISAISAYLEGIGHKVSTVQAHEVLARALGYKNKHVLASAAKNAPMAPPTLTAEASRTFDVEGTSLQVLSVDQEPLTVTQMRATKWKFDVILPIAIDNLLDIEMMTNSASKRITGDEGALVDVGFQHVPEVCYGKGWVAYRVSGYVEDPEMFFSEERERAEQVFYSDLLDLADFIKGNAEVSVLHQGQTTSEVIWRVHAEQRLLLKIYAQERGANNENVNRHAKDLVFETRDAHSQSYEVRHAVRLEDLKHAERTDKNTWSFSTSDAYLHLTFQER